MTVKSALIATSCLFAIATAPSLAQAPGAGMGEELNLNFVAGGVAALPDYSGSDDYRFIPFGAFRYEFENVTLRTDGPGVAAEFIEQGPLSGGVFARWSGGRDDVEDAIVALLPEVGNSVIVGAFAELEVADAILNDFDRLVIGARVGVDALGEFEGANWSLSTTYLTPLSRTSFIGLSAGINGVSDDYAEQLFSIDAAGAAASGLPVYALGGGIENYSLTALLNVGVSENWSVTGLLSYSKLAGDFADSPIVALRGSEDQVFAGLALGWGF